jgi:hypothetical protein
MPKSTTVRKTTSATVRKTKVIKSHKKSRKRVQNLEKKCLLYEHDSRDIIKRSIML